MPLPYWPASDFCHPHAMPYGTLRLTIIPITATITAPVLIMTGIRRCPVRLSYRRSTGVVPYIPAPRFRPCGPHAPAGAPDRCGTRAQATSDPAIRAVRYRSPKYLRAKATCVPDRPRRRCLMCPHRQATSVRRVSAVEIPA